MQDFFVEQLNDSTFDIVVENGNFKKVDSFETAIYFQVFTNKRATKYQVSTPRNRGGWMGDLITKPDYEVGSYVYIKEQSRNTQLDFNEIVEYAKLALKYFRNFGVKNIDVTLFENTISFKLTVENDTTLKYNTLWRNTNAT